MVRAATFSAPAVLVIVVELGVAVAVGVPLDALVVRSLLVPALGYDVGRWIRWPSRLSRGAATDPPRDAAPAVDGDAETPR